ncbi:hypothetical protein ES702_01484 [subsurface metagenome]
MVSDMAWCMSLELRCEAVRLDSRVEDELTRQQTGEWMELDMS